MVRKRLEYCLLLVAVTVFHVFFVDYLSFIIFSFFLTLPVISLVMTLFARRGIKAELEISSAFLQKNDVLFIHLNVKNTTYLTACRVRVKLVIRNDLLQEERIEILFLTAGRTGLTVEQKLTSKYCGKLTCRIDELRTYDYLGLFSFRQKTSAHQKCDVLILPSVFQLGDIHRDAKTYQDVESDTYSRIKAGDDPTEIFDIREYKNGDRLTKIHWKLTGKHEQVMVKDFGLPISTEALLLFDLSGGSKDLDGLMDTIYSVSRFLIESQVPHEMEWYSNQQGNTHCSIKQHDDLSAALSILLSEGRPKQGPLALTNCSNVRGLYSDVIYICSVITLDSITLLSDRMDGSRIRILVVSELSKLENSDLYPAETLGINLTTLDAANIVKSLAGLNL